MQDFKVGDIVECIDHGNSLYLVKGKLYTVVKNPSWLKDDTVYINVAMTINGRNYQQAYNKNLFKLIKKEFDMFNEGWAIRYSDEEEFELVKKFVKHKGFKFAFGEDHYPEVGYITNRTNKGELVTSGSNNDVMRVSAKEDRQEIVLNYKVTKEIDSVNYPEKTPEEVEVEKIEAEMRKLADRLSELKNISK